MLQIEIIPDEDGIARHVDFPRTYEAARRLVLDNVFEFPNGRAESIVWRKYALTESDVHRLGKEREARLQERRPEARYVGFIGSTAGMVRSIRTVPGHGFEVVHAPSEGQHHAHVQYRPNPAQQLQKPHKMELKYALRRAFSDLVPAPA